MRVCVCVRARAQVLALDIADRAPEDNPNGFPYNLIMEACVPSVDTGLRDIFEEHNIVPSAAHISAPQMQRVSRMHTVITQSHLLH